MSREISIYTSFNTSKNRERNNKSVWSFVTQNRSEWERGGCGVQRSKFQFENVYGFCTLSSISSHQLSSFVSFNPCNAQCYSSADSHVIIRSNETVSQPWLLSMENFFAMYIFDIESLMNMDMHTPFWYSCYLLRRISFQLYWKLWKDLLFVSSTDDIRRTGHRTWWSWFRYIS